MPVAPGGRFRMKDGVRLHFTKSGMVDEHKKMGTKKDKKRHGRTLLSR